MKNLPNDIHVEALTAKHGAEIIETFKQLGVLNPSNCVGNCTLEDNNVYRFYGIKDGYFTNRALSSELYVVSLDELKSYLEEDIPELPNGVLMYVSDSPIESLTDLQKSVLDRRFVFGKRNGVFYAWSNAEKIEDIDGTNGIVRWKYAETITEPKEVIMTVAEIEEKLGITNLKIVK